MQSFYAHRSQKFKKYSQAVSFFALLGSVRLKAVLVKSTPGVNLTNPKHKCASACSLTLLMSPTKTRSTLPELRDVLRNFSTLRSMPCVSKISA